MSSLMTYARVPFARLARSPRGWLPILGWSMLAFVAAVIAHTTSRVHGVDHVMKETFGFVALPLLTYGIVSAVLGGGGLRASLRGVVALGGAPERAALASIGVAMMSSALVSGVVAAAITVLARGGGDAPIATDLPMSFGVAFVGGAAYAAFYCAGSAIGRGAFRGVFLALDWIFGSGAGFGALFTPRGHVTSLLGGSMCFELSRQASSVALVVLLLAYGALAVVLARRPRV